MLIYMERSINLNEMCYVNSVISDNLSMTS